MASHVRSFVFVFSRSGVPIEGFRSLRPRWGGETSFSGRIRNKVGRMQVRKEGTVDRKQALSLREAVERGRRARWWRRRGSKGRGFWYVDARGARLGDEAHL